MKCPPYSRQRNLSKAKGNPSVSSHYPSARPIGPWSEMHLSVCNASIRRAFLSENRRGIFWLRKNGTSNARKSVMFPFLSFSGLSNAFRARPPPNKRTSCVDCVTQNCGCHESVIFFLDSVMFPFDSFLLFSFLYLSLVFWSSLLIMIFSFAVFPFLVFPSLFSIYFRFLYPLGVG